MFIKNCGNVKMVLFLNDGCCDMCLIDEYNTYNDYGDFSKMIDTFETQMILISNCGEYKTYLLYKEEYYEIGELINIFEEECKYIYGMKGDK